MKKIKVEVESKFYLRDKHFVVNIPFFTEGPLVNYLKRCIGHLVVHEPPVENDCCRQINMN